jgi:endonuclease III
MQSQFAFAGRDTILACHDALALPDEARLIARRRRPTGQLVKSLISGRTRDAVSLAAYHRLGQAFGSTTAIAEADPAMVRAVIADVTFAESKAQWLVAALAQIRRERGDGHLEFLADLPLVRALGWLERLPGVGRKVAASTLNASTLDRPVLIVDTHVLRVAQRLGLVAAQAEARLASETITAALPDWPGAMFLRLHLRLKRLGQRRCHVVQPNCRACPLNTLCPSRFD